MQASLMRQDLAIPPDGMREALALPPDTPDMRFFDVSGVSEQDLLDAQAGVLAAEKEGFADYLATAWQPVLQRPEPQAHMAANKELIEAMGEPFANRLQTRLREDGLENDVDAARIVEPQVRAEIEREIKGQLTRDFLDRQRLEIHPPVP